MFSKQTITKDPVSVQPTEFDVIVLLGFYSYPVAINVTGNEAVLDSTSWHIVESATVTASNPELLLIPWVANAVGSVLGNPAELTDSLLLGDISINITLAVTSLYEGGSDLAPSWYIRQPYKNEKKFPYDKFKKLEPIIDSKYVDAPVNNLEKMGIPWGEQEDISKSLSGVWNFIPNLDTEKDSPFQKFSDHFEYSIAQGYTNPDTKDLLKSLDWGEFDDLFASSFSYGYSYPETKDLEKDIPWNLFGNLFSSIFGLSYSHPPPKDVFKTIFIGPNWFPKWCINLFDYSHGDLTLNFLTGQHQPYQQYFSDQQFPLNAMEIVYPPAQLDKLPVSTNYPSAFPSGQAFGSSAVARGRKAKIELRGRTGATLNTNKSKFLEFPIYMNNISDDYELVCYDGYRTGPVDAYDYQYEYFSAAAPPDIRSYYFIMNTVTLNRVSDNAVIPLNSINIKTDLDSWCWSFQATLRRRDDLNLIVPSGTPVEVEAIINGYTWRFVVEDYGESIAFGKRSYTISGRSLSASLASPYTRPKSYIQDALKNAVQLAEEAIGASGFTVDWQLTDWQVPANVYSVQNKTPMQELITIANAAGGIVQSATATTTVRLLPKYKSLPWDWGGVVVDAAIPTFESRSTRFEAKPQYNGVYVSGQDQGVTCFVKRSGSDGSEQPQSVVDPLITEGLAGLQRGSTILADSGKRSIENISVPFLNNPGLLTPGMIVEVIDSYVTWRGQVLSVTLDAQRPKVTQSLSILKYHGS